MRWVVGGTPAPVSYFFGEIGRLICKLMAAEEISGGFPVGRRRPKSKVGWSGATGEPD